MADEIVQVIRDEEARVNVTYQGQNGDLRDPVFAQSSDGDVKGWVTEAVRNGGVPGIPADGNADFRDYVVDRFGPTEARPYNFIQVRPKTAFGAFNEVCDDDSPDDDAVIDNASEDNGPSDAEIEDMEIERQIEAQEQAAMEARPVTLPGQFDQSLDAKL
jgi:hypothetical protein